MYLFLVCEKPSRAGGWACCVREMALPGHLFRLSPSLAFGFQLETSAAETWNVSCLVCTRGSLRIMCVENTEIFNAFFKVCVCERYCIVLSFFVCFGITVFKDAFSSSG
jgi:hypothetical protein